MKMVYIAGKFSGKTRADVEVNIARATERGLQVAKIGGFPVIPHANTAHPDFEELQFYTFWIEGTMLQMLACDALLTVPGWTESSGARAEVKRMGEEGKPVFHNIASLEEWLETGGHYMPRGRDLPEIAGEVPLVAVLTRMIQSAEAYGDRAAEKLTEALDGE